MSTCPVSSRVNQRTRLCDDNAYSDWSAFFLSASITLGDGCYIPERAVRGIPEISAQQAVISWRDGVEILIVASALDSEAQTLGWIIPIPAVPETIEKATPGVLATLDYCIQPWITHDLWQPVKATLFVVLISNLLMATWWFKREQFGCLLSLVLLFLVLSSLLLSAAGGGGGRVTAASGVVVAKTATVGSYTVNILNSSQPASLDAWLAENGFAAMPESAAKIIADYISKHWVFAAIKLTRGESGANVPHPIKMAFASKEPIYPMKLTAIAGGSPRFELFVVGNDRASCDSLEETFCDQFSAEENETWTKSETKTYFSGSNSRCAIGHPTICSLMWDRCVLTKFAGTVDAVNMTDDIHFTWKPFKSHQEHFFTRYGAGCLAVILFAVVVGGWNIVSMRDYARGLVQPKGFGRYFVKKMIPAIALAAILAGVCFAALPKLDNADVQFVHWRRPPSDLPWTIDALLKESPDILRRSPSEIATFLLQGETAPGGRHPKNETTGSELKVEDSPGNFTLERKSSQLFVRVYDHIGRSSVNTYPIESNSDSSPPNQSPVQVTAEDFLAKATVALNGIQAKIRNDKILCPLATAKVEEGKDYQTGKGYLTIFTKTSESWPGFPSKNGPRYRGFGQLRIDVYAELPKELPSCPFIPPAGCYVGSTYLVVPDTQSKIIVDSMTSDPAAQRRLVNVVAKELNNAGIAARPNDPEKIDSVPRPSTTPPPPSVPAKQPIKTAPGRS